MRRAGNGRNDEAPTARGPMAWFAGLDFPQLAGGLLCVVACLATVPSARARAVCADVSLVLAVDGSSSIDDHEFALQRQGIAGALRDPAVIAAMKRAGVVAISAVFWGDSEQAVEKTGWTTITGPQDGERFARIIERMDRGVYGGTGLGAGLTAALDMAAAPDACAGRSIINVSGDGKETIYPRRRRAIVLPEEARARAEAQGVTINALVITGQEAGLERYFTDRVITGPGAFVMTVRNSAEFAGALRRKLIREISPMAISRMD